MKKDKSTHEVVALIVIVVVSIFGLVALAVDSYTVIVKGATNVDMNNIVRDVLIAMLGLLTHLNPVAGVNVSAGPQGEVTVKAPLSPSSTVTPSPSAQDEGSQAPVDTLKLTQDDAQAITGATTVPVELGTPPPNEPSVEPMEGDK